jgi:glycosyltransferase involved in cell wall biosynthesis
MEKKSIWITWEKHRRTEELAEAVGAKLYVLEHNPTIGRYFVLIARTLMLIHKERAQIVFSQNPSLILAFLLCYFKRFYGFCCVVDRHSNFKLDTLNSKRIKWIIFHMLSRYSVRKADLTIVTNKYLQDLVISWGGVGYILPDRLPNLKLGNRIQLQSKVNIVLISTFSADEPIKEIVKAVRKVNKEWQIFITGDFTSYRYKHELMRDLPNNVRLTGYIPEKEYQSLIMSANLLVVLTVNDHTLNCGSYEGVSLGIPMVLSDTKAIRDYFTRGVIYTRPNSNSIAGSIQIAISQLDHLNAEIKLLRKELLRNWENDFSSMIKIVDNTARG